MQGFPVTVRTGGGETIVIDKDTTGQLWVTFTQSNKVWLRNSTTSDLVWASPFNPPNVPGDITYEQRRGGRRYLVADRLQQQDRRGVEQPDHSDRSER